MEIPATQERPNVQPADSEIFYKTGLVNKLLAMADTSMADTSQSINCTLQSNISNATLLESTNQSVLKQHRKQTFNLAKILQNSVYPEECTQNSGNMVNASFVENHLSSSQGSAFQQSFMHGANQIFTELQAEDKNNTLDESLLMDETVVDEQLVLSLTQQHCPASQYASKDISCRLKFH